MKNIFNKNKNRAEIKQTLKIRKPFRVSPIEISQKGAQPAFVHCKFVFSVERDKSATMR